MCVTLAIQGVVHCQVTCQLVTNAGWWWQSESEAMGCRLASKHSSCQTFYTPKSVYDISSQQQMVMLQGFNGVEDGRHGDGIGGGDNGRVDGGVYLVFPG